MVSLSNYVDSQVLARSLEPLIKSQRNTDGVYDSYVEGSENNEDEGSENKKSKPHIVDVWVFHLQNQDVLLVDR